MTRTHPPDFDSEFEELGPIWSIIWDAEEHACERARAFFPEFADDPSINADLFPDLQRYFARRKLMERGIHDDDFVEQRLARNGIAFGYQGRNVRLWKKGREAMPRGGRSGTKIKFLGQQLFLPFVNPFQVVLPSRVIMYETGSDYRLRRLWFGLPLSGSEEAATEVYWVKPVTFDMIAGFGATSTVASSDDHDETDNLPFMMAVESDEGNERGEESVNP